MKDRALKIIEALKAEYNTDQFHFMMNCSMIISGPHNKTMRQTIMELLTGTKQPATKCGLHNVAEQLKASFEQISLF